MSSIMTITRHGFLTPGHNSWALWTHEGSQNITNPGPSHRVLETLSYTIDKLIGDGWQVKQIYVEQGTPTIVFLTREEIVNS